MKIKLDMFEGPLDLLLYLIEKAQIDIYEVPIADITNQYMQILFETEQLELEIASEFLVMAATLIAIKSRMLLPHPKQKEEETFLTHEDQLDPRQELVERLLEYKRYKRLSEDLKEKEENRSMVYSRLPMDLRPFSSKINPVQGLTTDRLLQAMMNVFQQRIPLNPIRTIQREEISISDCMEEIYKLLLTQGPMLFSNLFRGDINSQSRIITTFLALLELMKLNRIICKQQDLFDDILIEMVQVNI
jgi:segregation and condensation protein A